MRKAVKNYWRYLDMRRLWAYIIVVFAAVVAVIASFPGVVKSLSTDGEFKTRRVFTFQLREREATDDDVDPAALTENSAKEVADIMKSRLETYNVSSYDLKTVGNDMITVSFSAETDTKYQQIITYLSFSGSFALVNKHNDVVEGDFRNGAAYTKSYAVNEYPTVIIPVNTEAKNYPELIEGCVEEPEEETEGEDEEATTKQIGRIYLIYNWQKGESYQSLSESNQLSSRTLFTIDFELDDDKTGLYYDSNKNSFSKVCGFQDANGNGYADPQEVRDAYAQADYLLNLFSASAFDYEVNCIKGLSESTKEYIDVKTEQVVNPDTGRLVWNRTLTAIVALIVIVSLLLVFFYKTGAASIIATTMVSAFLIILIMAKTGLVYNSLGVVGVVLVTLLSLVSGVIYLNKVKEDSYKGHTLKKANAEASKKSLLPIIDIHVVGLIIGIMLYAFGGTPLRTLSAVLAIGSIVSGLISIFGLKGLMWLLTNSTVMNGRYDLLGINKENVPNHMAEEKQTYYGPYADKDFSKKKKPVGFISLGAVVLALAGIIAFSSVRGGNLFKQPAVQSLGNEIYVHKRIQVVNDETNPLNDTSLETILSNILIEQKSGVAIDESNPETYYTLKDCIKDRILFEATETKVDAEDNNSTNNYLDTYFRLTLSKQLTGNEIATIKGYSIPAESTLEYVFKDYFNITSELDPIQEEETLVPTMQLKAVNTVVNPASPKWTRIILGTSIAILIVTVYLMLRYRLSRGLASLLFPVAGSLITVGIMLLLNLFLNLSASVIIAVPVVSLFSYLFLIQFYNRERELLLEDKIKDNSKEHRADVAKRAFAMAYAPILVTTVLGVYCLINFFGFAPSVMSNAYMMMFIGVIISLGIIQVLAVPMCNWLFNLFSKVSVNKKPKENKKAKNKPIKKSAEPEEAIFIGIND